MDQLCFGKQGHHNGKIIHFSFFHFFRSLLFPLMDHLNSDNIELFLHHLPKLNLLEDFAQDSLITPCVQIFVKGKPWKLRLSYFQHLLQEYFHRSLSTKIIFIAPASFFVLENVASKTNLKVDFGGGIKSAEDLRIAFESGANQITGGSIAVKEPDTFLGWLKYYGGDKIILFRRACQDVRADFIRVNQGTQFFSRLINHHRGTHELYTTCCR